MSQTAHKMTLQEPFSEAALVIWTRGQDVRLRRRAGEATARRAASCLLAPCPGDKILVTFLPEGTAYVLAVLERAQEQTAEISVAGNLRLEAKNGTCEVVGGDGVALRSDAKVSIASEMFDLCAAEGSLVLGKLNALAQDLQIRADSVTFSSTSLKATCNRVMQVIQSCFRKVEQMDQLRAGRLDYRAEHEVTLKGENLLFGAKKLVKADGEQIHIG